MGRRTNAQLWATEIDALLVMAGLDQAARRSAEPLLAAWCERKAVEFKALQAANRQRRKRARESDK